MTIGDKIRSMTDAELAGFIDRVTSTCFENRNACGEECPLHRKADGFCASDCSPKALEAKLRLPWEEG